MKDVILTGLRSNDEFHLGNYLGGIRPMLQLQREHNDDQHQVNMFIPDLHSFTTPIDHRQLHQQSIDNLAVFVASGLDLNQANTYLYRQSYIPAHSELCVILNNFAYFGELSRMTEFKSKSEELSSSEGSISVGLFDYPVLMAADILLHSARWVPVGDDQRQHLELARDLAMRVNNKFQAEFPDGVFTVPESVAKQNQYINLDQGLRIRSLRRPENKMSKSVDDPAGTIRLSDDPKEAASKVSSATTDSVGSINYDFDAQPGISNLLVMQSQLSNTALPEVIEQWQGQSSYGELKQTVATSVETFLTEFQQRLEDVNERMIMAKLETDEAIMRDRTADTLLRVQQAAGLREL